jgi:hypothetical protein
LLEILHSRWYKNGAPFQNKNVLVIGAGNSGTEQATDLLEHGANVDIVITQGRHFVPLKIMHVGVLLANPTILKLLWKSSSSANNTKSTNRFLLSFAKNLEEYGIPLPKQSLADDPYYIPNIDQGFIQVLKEQKLRVIPWKVSQFTPNGVQFENGSSGSYDAVILATGLQTGLEKFFGASRDLFLKQKPGLEKYGWFPKSTESGQSKVDKALYFVGYEPHMIGLLNGYSGWSTGESIVKDHYPSLYKSFLNPPVNQNLLLISVAVPLVVMSAGVFLFYRRRLRHLSKMNTMQKQSTKNPQPYRQ